MGGEADWGRKDFFVPSEDGEEDCGGRQVRSEDPAGAVEEDLEDQFAGERRSFAVGGRGREDGVDGNVRYEVRDSNLLGHCFVGRGEMQSFDKGAKGSVLYILQCSRWMEIMIE